MGRDMTICNLLAVRERDFIPPRFGAGTAATIAARNCAEGRASETETEALGQASADRS